MNDLKPYDIKPGVCIPFKDGVKQNVPLVISLTWWGRIKAFFTGEVEFELEIETNIRE